MSANIKSSQQKMSALNGDAKAAAAIGSQYGAEVLLVGTAISREATGMSQNLGGMVSVQGDVTLKAINCSNARVIGTASGHAAQVHIVPNTAGSMAIDKASTKSVKDLLDVIIKEWQNQVNNGMAIQVIVKNVTTFRQKAAIMQTLNGISNISAARERSWDADSKQLEVDLQYKGNVDGFCTRIDGYKLKTGGGSLAVAGVNGNAVTLNAEAL
jgi:competence protein ComGC